MVLQKAVDNMKGRPQDERKAVAGGIAVMVVAVLVVVWSILFLRGLRHTAVDQQTGGATNELRQLREQSAAQQAQIVPAGELDYQAGGDPFGN